MEPFDERHVRLAGWTWTGIMYVGVDVDLDDVVEEAASLSPSKVGKLVCACVRA